MAEKAKVEIVTLGQLCTEFKIDAQEVREKLRCAKPKAKKYRELAKAHKPRRPREWAKDYAAVNA